MLVECLEYLLLYDSIDGVWLEWRGHAKECGQLGHRLLSRWVTGSDQRMPLTWTVACVNCCCHAHYSLTQYWTGLNIKDDNKARKLYAIALSSLVVNLVENLKENHLILHYNAHGISN